MDKPEQFPSASDEAGDFLESERQQAFLYETYPDVIAIMPSLLDGTIQMRLDQAGFVQDDMLHSDGTVEPVVYSIRQTDTVQRIGQIWVREQAGEEPPGSHDQALQDVINGSFI